MEEVVVVVLVEVLVAEGCLLPKGGEGLIAPRLLLAFKYLSVGHGVHAGHVQVAAVVGRLAPV